MFIYGFSDWSGYPNKKKKKTTTKKVELTAKFYSWLDYQIHTSFLANKELLLHAMFFVSFFQ